MSADKVGRNDRCPCGSGRKYKQCCGAKGESRSQLGTYALIGVLIAIVGVVPLQATSQATEAVAPSPLEVIHDSNEAILAALLPPP